MKANEKSPAMPGAIRKTEPPGFFLITFYQERDKDRGFPYFPLILLMAASMAGKENVQSEGKD